MRAYEWKIYRKSVYTFTLSSNILNGNRTTHTIRTSKSENVFYISQEALDLLSVGDLNLVC